MTKSVNDDQPSSEGKNLETNTPVSEVKKAHQEESSNQDNRKEPWYAYAQPFFTGLSLIVVPITVALATNYYTNKEAEAKLELADKQSKQKQEILKLENKQRQQALYINIGLKILSETPNEDNKNLRTWATELINHYSEVGLKQEAKNELVLKVSLSPFDPIASSNNGEDVTPYTLKWTGSAESSYRLEVQAQKGGKWVFVHGATVNGNQFQFNMPVNTNLRWQAVKYKGSGSEMPNLNENNWKYLYLENKR